jgi:probable blue pigment (indigoidine) exporter
MRQVLPGILFAMLWASAAVATKFGIKTTDPLILANTRFIVASALMLAYAYGIRRGKYRLPRGAEWRHLLIFALLNTTIYLGAFVLALEQVSAGIGSLAIATNPLFISLLSAVWLQRRLRWYEAVGLFLGLAGVGVATYPLLQHSHATVAGLLILLGGMLSVSAATVYYARVPWDLPSVVINGWQVLLGGLCLLPFTFFTADFNSTQLNFTFWASVLWLVIPVSIVSLQLWFYLVTQDTVKAALWLFLCPIFGFFYAWALLSEPITIYTVVGTLAVIFGLYLAQREKFR